MTFPSTIVAGVLVTGAPGGTGTAWAASKEDNGVIVPATTSPPDAMVRINSLRVISLDMTINLLENMRDIVSQQHPGITDKNFLMQDAGYKMRDSVKSIFPILHPVSEPQRLLYEKNLLILYTVSNKREAYGKSAFRKKTTCSPA
jgi:hypothetical protein